MKESRLILVSNRLPVTGAVDGERMTVRRSDGGLATGLSKPHERSGGVWLGWPGDVGNLTTAQREDLDQQLDRMRLVPVHLSRDEVERYYAGYSNGVLWPLFHYLLESVPLSSVDWPTYKRVNAKFADRVAAVARDADLIWIHDYQLMLLPALVRQRLPRARIGFFLHIPFPSSEVFRTLPQRNAILEGLLGADLVGFHTAAYARHFAASVLRILGAPTEIDRVRLGDRDVRLGVFPMGIDTGVFEVLGEDVSVQAGARQLRGENETMQHLVGIDRLDYTKGIPRRLLAFERFLADHPELHERVRLIQVAVPTREHVEAYQRFRRSVERLVGRINGSFGTPRWVPVHYIMRSLPPQEVATLYRLADVMVVTPLRDGMNLVAKEFVASRTDLDGVLVLSELAGAASELAEALHVNPYDVEATAATLHRALVMPRDERRVRMRGLRQRVLTYDVHGWVDDFVTTLARSRGARRASLQASPADTVMRALEAARAAPQLVLVLDYDGTLVPFEATPELAVPPPELLELLARLARRPATEAHILSGRGREVLQRWFGELAIGLHAEHGGWSRAPGSQEWSRLETTVAEWKPRVRRILEQFAARTPGSLVEEKEQGLAWHYRAADAQFGQRQANELRLHLTEVMSNTPVEILTGSKVVEIRPHGAHKGRVVARLAGEMRLDGLLVAMGDDLTDEDMFAALPEGALAVHVGPEQSSAALRLAGPSDARAWLVHLCA